MSSRATVWRGRDNFKLRNESSAYALYVQDDALKYGNEIAMETSMKTLNWGTAQTHVQRIAAKTSIFSTPQWTYAIQMVSFVWDCTVHPDEKFHQRFDEVPENQQEHAKRNTAGLKRRLY